MPDILRTHALSRFSCLGDRCEDTCCQGWSMQVDEATRERYQKEAPELLEAVEPSTDAPWIMRKDPQTGMCVKLDNGLCGIHKQRGEAFLGDACHFYPRVTRALGDRVTMTATMSCPEIARLALAQDDACGMEPAALERLPHTVKNYLPEGVAQEDALATHRAFLEATQDDGASAEKICARIASVSRSMERIDKAQWAQAAPFYLKHADARLPAAEPKPEDPFNLLHALGGLIVASHKPPSARLKQTIAEMERALAATLDWQNVTIQTTEASASAYRALQTRWRADAAPYDPLLRRWLRMQLSLALYPYGGFGTTLTERITIIGVRLATVKLALMCAHHHHGATLPQDTVIRVVQSLARLLDHLGDPAFSLQIYAETGWVHEGRLRGLLEI